MSHMNSSCIRKPYTLKCRVITQSCQLKVGYLTRSVKKLCNLRKRNDHRNKTNLRFKNTILHLMGGIISKNVHIEKDNI